MLQTKPCCVGVGDPSETIRPFKVTLVVPSWMVMATHGWWFPERPGAEPSLYGTFESNINLLLPMGEQGKDGLGAPVKHSMCRIYKVDEKEKYNG